MNELKEKFLSGEVILIDKPLNWTSFQVVNKVRWMIKTTFGIKKIKVGHAGTLDPLASGLLILCTGKMTKQIENGSKTNGNRIENTLKSVQKQIETGSHGD